MVLVLWMVVVAGRVVVEVTVSSRDAEDAVEDVAVDILPHQH